MVICPCCDQDYIWYVSMRLFPQEIITFCFECDTVWKSVEDIGNHKGKGIKMFQEEIFFAGFEIKKLAKLE